MEQREKDSEVKGTACIEAQICVKMQVVLRDW